MHGHNNELAYVYTMNNVDDYLASLPYSSMAAITNNEHDHHSISAAMKPELCYSPSGCSSCYGGSTSSLTSTYGTNDPSFLQRSITVDSLQKNVFEGFSPLVSSPNAYAADSETSSVRKVYSAGDLQEVKQVRRNHRSESPLSIEISIIESMNKACRYSPEEKRERIERYRSKRNLRNFNKKIKYECRKTLADSRPRIRGRFAKNDEIEKMTQNEWGQAGHVEMEEDEYDDNWLNFLDAYSANLIP